MLSVTWVPMKILVRQFVNFYVALGITDAAVLMLKNKIHRIPIVNDKNQVVGKWQISTFCLCFLESVILVILTNLISGILIRSLLL